MCAKSNKNGSGPIKLNLNVDLLEAREQKIPDLSVFVYDRNGKYLESASLKQSKGLRAELSLKNVAIGDNVKVLLVPPLDQVFENIPQWWEKMLPQSIEKKNEIPYTNLINKGAYAMNYRLSESVLDLDMVLQPSDWFKWIFCKCEVKGRLIKRITLPDGSTKDLGVCGACVLIYEVDKWPKLIFRLPDKYLFKFREEILKYIEIWPPPPILEELPEFVEEVGPIPPPPPYKSMRLMKNPEMNSNSGDRELFKAEIQPVLTAKSATQLRNALVEKSDALMSLACLWDWLHYYYKKDLIKCACTDDQGRFSTTIWYQCAGDKPDLYFRAAQCIGGTLHWVYDPPVPCHTYWNYNCGQEVVLISKDPAAITCAPSDPVIVPSGVNTWVMPFAIGGITINNIKSTGLTDYSGYTDAPFGDRLGFRHGYSSNIPLTGANKPYYYRWRYKKDDETTYRDFAPPVAKTVVRHYIDKDLSTPFEPPTFPAYVLGPKSVNNMHLYEFKPHNPPQPAGHKTEWPIDSWFSDIYTGIIESDELPGGISSAHGLYNFKLEVYNHNGNKIAPGNSSFRFIVPDGFAPDGVTILSRHALSSEIEDDGYKFNVHIDNRKCVAVIEAPEIDGVTAGDICGFLRYDTGDDVEIYYHALHPGKHATFSFYIRRAITVIFPASGEIAQFAAGVYIGDGNGNYKKNDFSPASLLGTCSEAAFAEILRVYAKATNGWDRLNKYDAYTERAFALAPKP